MRTVLVTGATGFVGRHLLEHLLTRTELRVVGLHRGRAGPQAVEWRQCDLLDPEATRAVVRDLQPDWVFHLAGFANPQNADTHVAECWASNLGATKTLFTCLAENDTRPSRILLASSAFVYGIPPETVTEDTPLRPTREYGKSKAAAEQYAHDEAPKLGLEVVRARLFNAVGVGQLTGYAIPDWAAQIARIVSGSQPSPFIPEGDLSGWKDLTDVCDVVLALRLLMETEKWTPGEAFNVGTGESHLSLDVLNQMIRLASDTLPKLPSVVPRPKWTADVTKLHAATGWRPLIPLAQSLSDVLNWWRQQPV